MSDCVVETTVVVEDAVVVVGVVVALAVVADGLSLVTGRDDLKTDVGVGNEVVVVGGGVVAGCGDVDNDAA